MYEYITGRLTFISPSYVVLDVNGFGDRTKKRISNYGK